MIHHNHKGCCTTGSKDERDSSEEAAISLFSMLISPHESCRTISMTHHIHKGGCTTGSKV